jgi:hypothetical protein
MTHMCKFNFKNHLFSSGRTSLVPGSKDGAGQKAGAEKPHDCAIE